MSTDLIPVFTGTLGGQPALLCNARELHAFLGVGRDFSNWMSDRIGNYRFVEGEDFVRTNSPVLANRADGMPSKPRTDYHLTIDMAKELAMVERTDKGRQVRRYFIACEQRQALPAADAARLAAERDALRKALLAENPDFARIVRYHAIQGLTHAEKAKLMGWSSPESWRRALLRMAELKLIDYRPDRNAGAKRLLAFHAQQRARKAAASPAQAGKTILEAAHV